jgi:Sulfotransferase family
MLRSVQRVGGLSGAFAPIRHVVAVVGCQRSGTTLTGQLLGAHPDAVLADEPDGIYPWFHAEAAGDSNASAAADDVLGRAAGKYRDPRSRFVAGGARVRLAPHVRWLVLKAPNLTYDDEALARCPVPLTVIYPVRDPRAVVASMQRLSAIDFVGNQVRLIEERPAVAARLTRDADVLRDGSVPLHVRRAVVWRVKSSRADDFAAQGLRCVQFRYEDLVAEPRATARRLLEACALSPADDVLSAHRAYVGSGPGGTDRTRAIDATSLARWRDVLSAEEEREVLGAAAPFAERFGYA